MLEFKMCIDPNDFIFQQGRYLYEAQVLLSELDENKEISVERVREMGKRYCQLVSRISFLRHDYLELIGSVKKLKEKFVWLLKDLNNIEVTYVSKTE